MVADFLGEAAVLVAVFAPLEQIVTGGAPAMTWGEVAIIGAMAGDSLIAGICVEVLR
jgi:hypothetical protein